MNVRPVNLSIDFSIQESDSEIEIPQLNIDLPLEGAILHEAPPLQRRVNLFDPSLAALKAQLVLWRQDPTISTTKRAMRQCASELILNCLRNQHCTLDLTGLQLDSLPDLIWECTSIDELNIESNRLAHLSPQIAKLTNLRILNLSENLLTEIPQELNQLSDLTELHLEGNQLGSIPIELARIYSNCAIYLDGNPIPEEILDLFMQIADTIAAERDHVGPTIVDLQLTFSERLNSWISHYHQLHHTKDPSLPNELYIGKVSKTNPFYQPIMALPERDRITLSNFLEYVKETSDFEKAPAATLLTIVRLISGLVQEEAFRLKALEYMEEALGACEDRISLRLGDIDVLWQLHFLYNPRDTQTVVALLLGAHRMKLLDELVLRKVEEEKIYDAVELLLYNRMKLKDALNLPLQHVSMIYDTPEWTRTTEDELNKRRDQILEQTTKAESVATILIQSDLWQEKLGREIPREFTKIQERSARNLAKLDEKKANLTSQEFADANKDALLLYEKSIRHLRYNATLSIVKRLGFESERVRHKRKEFA